MEKVKVLISGSTGTTGRPAVEALLEKGIPVRALVHKEDSRSARLQALGAEIVVGDMQNLDDMRSAWSGVKRAYFCYPVSPALLDVTVIFAEAAKEAGAELIVNMSQKQVAPTVKSPATIRHFLSEEVFKWSGVPTTQLRPTFFSDWFLWVARMIQFGQLKMSFPADAVHAPVAGEDIGRTVASILANPEPHAGRTYQLFGPQLLTYTQLGEIISEVVKKDIKYENVSVQEMANLMGIGGYDHLVAHIGSTEGDNVYGPPNFNHAIEEITGIPPMSFHQFIEKNRAAFIA